MKHPDFLDKRDYTGAEGNKISKEAMSPNNEAIHDEINRIAEEASTKHDSRYLKEYIKTGINMAQSNVSDHDFSVMVRTVREMYFANTIFQPYRHIRKITIFGSARIKPGEPAYDTTKQFAVEASDHGYMVITGGGPGIMQAGNEGAGAERSFGLNIQLPFEQQANHIIRDNPRSIDFYYFFVRKLNFVAESDAMVACPGGFGTMDEIFESLTLIQTGKAKIYPVVLLDSPGKTFWLNWLAFIRVELVDAGLISEDDLHLIHVTKSPSEAIDHIDQFYRIFHSYRFVGDQIVIRTNADIPDQWVTHLEHNFADLIKPGGKISKVKALDEEKDEPEIAALPRIAFPIQRGNYGRLRLLIDQINQMPSRSYKP